jgi:ATP-dependent DNA helicase DinG
LQTAPIDVAPYIRKYVFNAQTSSVFTSATLSINENPQNFREKCGAENEMFLLENSPFDYENHTNIYVVEDAPSFDYDKQGKLHEYFADYIQFCASMSEGGLLVLFTSYAEMKKTALLNRTSVRIEGRKILVQGEGVPRSEMLKIFKDDGNAVLFGTDSFGTGVDIPGKALSQVILTRLPFENPSHPISQARSEWVSERGGSPFVDIMLPDAIIKFRQGVGRLIRKTNDKGAITVLDSRILKKEYGRQFLGALPKTLFTKMSKATRTKLFTIPK